MPQTNDARDQLAKMIGLQWDNASDLVAADRLADAYEDIVARAETLKGITNRDHLPEVRIAAARFGEYAAYQLPDYAHHFQVLRSLKEDWPSNWRGPADVNAQVGFTMRDVREQFEASIAREEAQ